MNDQKSKMNGARLDRRKFLIAGTGLAAASLLTRVPATAQNQAGQGVGGYPPTGTSRASRRAAGSSVGTEVAGRRRLGRLEVSSVGMGVQNMHRKYTTEVPYRPEMINILRTAFDRGVTFFDCAEATNGPTMRRASSALPAP